MAWLNRLLGTQFSTPNVGAGKRVFAVGDIHGRADLLEILLEQIQAYASQNEALQNTLVFLGDYVDRGSNSRGVLQTLIDLQIPGWTIVYLRGNHDQAVLNFLNDSASYRSWRSYGAPETLLSYGVTPPRFEDLADFARVRDAFALSCPHRHLKFLNDLRYFHVEGDYAFVHAGVRPGIALADQDPEDLLWIREEFLLYRRHFQKVIVHGHTPSSVPVKLTNRIGVDTGAHATDCLTAAVLEGDKCLFLDTRDRFSVKGRPRLVEALTA